MGNEEEYWKFNDGFLNNSWNPAKWSWGGRGASNGYTWSTDDNTPIDITGLTTQDIKDLELGIPDEGSTGFLGMFGGKDKNGNLDGSFDIGSMKNWGTGLNTLGNLAGAIGSWNLGKAQKAYLGAATTGLNKNIKYAESQFQQSLRDKAINEAAKQGYYTDSTGQRAIERQKLIDDYIAKYS